MASKKTKTSTPDISLLVDSCLENESELKDIVANLACDSRSKRQESSEVVAGVAKQNAEILLPYVKDIVDALNRPEQKTRWRCLEALTKLVEMDPKGCEKAIDAADDALFDEKIGSLRLASFKFLAALGATSKVRSKKIWPLMDEAIQCYHGDVEFDDMLKSTYEFAKGALDTGVKTSVVERFEFDAETAKGSLQERSINIINAVKGKK